MATPKTPIDDPGGQLPVEEKQEPHGKANTGRSYRILVWSSATEEGELISWHDYGLFPGDSPVAAIKSARKDPAIREPIAKGNPVVAIPESYFSPLQVTVETIEREAFKPVKV